MSDSLAEDADLYDRAYAAVDAGQLQQALALFRRLAEDKPDNPAFHYMLGLAHKYRFEWAKSLACNLHALALYEEPDEACLWNAANVFERLERSAFDTFEVELTSPDEQGLEDLLEMRRPGIGLAEDWTSSVQAICKKCSEGLVHHHEPDEAQAWNPEREIGIAAQGRSAVERLLQDWAGAGPGRRVEAIRRSRHEPQPPREGFAWWRGADEGEEDAA